MNNDTATNTIDIKKQVLEKINSNEIKMKPKFYFMLRVGGLLFLLLLTLTISILIISYILFALKISGQLFLLGLGFKGLQAFIILFPWLFILVDCILLVVLDWGLKKFRFAYHSPLLYLFVGSLGIIFVLGYAVNFTSLHNRLLELNQQKQLFLFGNLYTGLEDLHKDDGIFKGRVISINDNSFVVIHDDSEKNIQEKIMLTGNVKDTSQLHIGDYVFIAGDRVGNEIRAFGVSKILK